MTSLSQTGRSLPINLSKSDPARPLWKKKKKVIRLKHEKYVPHDKTILRVLPLAMVNKKVENSKETQARNSNGASRMEGLSGAMLLSAACTTMLILLLILETVGEKMYDCKEHMSKGYFFE